jgi:hypothetical protein
MVTPFAFKSMFIAMDPMGFVILDGFGCWSCMQAKYITCPKQECILS